MKLYLPYLYIKCCDDKHPILYIYENSFIYVFHICVSYETIIYIGCLYINIYIQTYINMYSYIYHTYEIYMKNIYETIYHEI